MRHGRWTRPFAAAATPGILATLTGVAIAPEGKSPARCNVDLGGPVKVRMLVPDGVAPGASVPISGTITLRQDAADLVLTTETRGGVEIALDPLQGGPYL